MLDDQFEDGHFRQFHDQFGHTVFWLVCYCVYHSHSPQFEVLKTFLAKIRKKTHSRIKTLISLREILSAKCSEQTDDYQTTDLEQKYLNLLSNHT